MAFKHKFTYEEKVKIVSEYIDGTYGFREICKRYDINQGSLKDWKRLYETFGWSGLKTGSKTTRYSKETKEAAVRDYLSHEFTLRAEKEHAEMEVAFLKKLEEIERRRG